MAWYSCYNALMGNDFFYLISYNYKRVSNKRLNDDNLKKLERDYHY